VKIVDCEETRPTPKRKLQMPACGGKSQIPKSQIPKKFQISTSKIPKINQS